MDERQYIPFHTTTLTNQKVLVLAPHPDDESLGCGGSLILHRRNRDAVRIVFLTDGGRGNDFEARSPDTDIQLREQEAQVACEALGVLDFEFWRVPDRTLAERQEPVDRLSVLLCDYQPDLVYVPSPLEFHPDHRAAANIVWRAIHTTQIKTNVAYYEVNTPIRINTLVDISAVVEQKKKACNAYASQQQHTPYTDLALSLNRFRSLTVSKFCTHAEGYYLLPSDTIRRTLLNLLPDKGSVSVPVPYNAYSARVSIIVRTQNRMLFLRDALSSILAQTYPHIDVIVINDGGQNIDRLIQAFKHKLTIQYHTYASAKGRSAAANMGLALAQGKYISFLDDDDLLHPDHIAKLVHHFEATGTQFAYSDCDMGHYRRSESGYHLVRPKRLYKGVDFDRDRLYRGNYIPIMTAMFTKELVDKTGSFDEAFDVFEDWDLWIRMSQHTDFRRLPGVTATYRVFSNPQYDYFFWRCKIYAKHKPYCTAINLVKWLHILESENECLTEANLELRSLWSRANVTPH